MIGALDTPRPGAFVSGRVAVEGWAASEEAEVAGVVILAGGVLIGAGPTGRSRLDVAAVHPGIAGAARSGWRVEVDLSGRTPGRCELIALAIEVDGTSHEVGRTAVQITDEWPPDLIGMLDEPVDGAVATDKGLWVRGWTAPPPDALARVRVLVDGVEVGLAMPFTPRPDVAALVAHADAPLAGFEFLLDPSVMTGAEGKLSIEVVGQRGSRRSFGPARIQRATTAPASAPPLRRPRPRSGWIRRAGDMLVFTPNLRRGGAQNYLVELLVRLVPSTGRAATVVTQCDGPHRHALERAGVRVVVTSSFPLFDADEYEGRVGETAAWIAAEGCEVVVGNTRECFPAIDAASRAGVPAVWAIHESTRPSLYWANHPGDLPSQWIPQRMLHALEAAAAVVFATDATRVLYAPWLGSRGVTLPCGVDLDAVAAARAGLDRSAARLRLGIDLDDTLVVCLGLVVQSKGQAMLAHVLGAHLADHPTLRGVFLGRSDLPRSRSYADAIDEWLRRSGLHGRIECAVMTDEPWPWLVAADLLVHPSELESLPFAVLEAMAFEVPVVAASVYGVPDVVVSGESGWLVPPGDVEALGMTISEVLGLPAGARAAVARRGRAEIETNHSLDRYVERFAEVLANVT